MEWRKHSIYHECGPCCHDQETHVALILGNNIYKSKWGFTPIYEKTNKRSTDDELYNEDLRFQISNGWTKHKVDVRGLEIGAK